MCANGTSPSSKSAKGVNLSELLSQGSEVTHPGHPSLTICLWHPYQQGVLKLPALFILCFITFTFNCGAHWASESLRTRSSISVRPLLLPAYLTAQQTCPLMWAIKTPTQQVSCILIFPLVSSPPSKSLFLLTNTTMMLFKNTSISSPLTSHLTSYSILSHLFHEDLGPFC